MMKKTLMLLAALTAVSGTKADEITGFCGCEHFATQFDQICLIRVTDEPSPGALYIYDWSATDPRVIINHTNPISPIATADCVGGSGCTVKLSVRVRAVDNFYYPVRTITLQSQEFTCASGTPNPGGGNPIF